MTVITSLAILSTLLLGFNGADAFARIKYGELANQKFPFLVYLASPVGDDVYRTCGGSIIAPGWVLTAAHCVVDTETGITEQGDSMLIYADTLESFNGQVFQSANVFPHENYKPLSLHQNDNDIALVKLRTPIPSNVGSPVQLGSAETDYTGTRVLAIGWGLTENGDTSEQLRKGRLTLIEKEQCVTFGIPDQNGDVMDDGSRKLCSYVKNGAGHTATGEGDSGGPILIGDESDVEGLVQIGLVSYGSNVTMTRGFQKTLKMYDVFTDVTQYLDWIQDTMDANSE